MIINSVIKSDGKVYACLDDIIQYLMQDGIKSAYINRYELVSILSKYNISAKKSQEGK